MLKNGFEFAFPCPLCGEKLKRFESDEGKLEARLLHPCERSYFEQKCACGALVRFERCRSEVYYFNGIAYGLTVQREEKDGDV